MTQPNLSKRQARWLDFLAEFDFIVDYRPGKSNVVADALSRINAVGREIRSEGHQDLHLFQELDQLYSKDSQTHEIL